MGKQPQEAMPKSPVPRSLRWGSFVLRAWEQMAVEDWQHWLDNGTWLDLMASTT